MSFLSNKKLRKYWYDGIHRILIELGVTTVYQPGSTFIKEYRLQTSVGFLTIHPPSPNSEFMSICSRFDDVEAANLKFGRVYHHNPYSGKYNLHMSIPGKVKPEEKIEYVKQALIDVRRHFESVMEV